MIQVPDMLIFWLQTGINEPGFQNVYINPYSKSTDNFIIFWK